jgi:diguanylate cyclase (GGDEF)-like protein
MAYLANVQETFTSSDPKELERLTLLDSLTQLYNQRTIVRILKDEAKRARRYKQPLTILACAVDGLKNISASHGAIASDSILQGFANFIMKSIRDVDIPARFDLERFLVVCPQTDAAGIAVLSERLRRHIEAERISDIGQNWHVTISIGVAAFPTNANSAEELLEKAFEALSVSMASGGNKATMA